MAAAHEQGLIESGNQVLLTAQENLFHTPFNRDSSSIGTGSSYVKLQKVESSNGRSLIGGLFNSTNNSSSNNVTYTDIKPEDHLKTYQF